MGYSIWEQETFYAPQDVIIVGSGFAGLWSAFYLKKKSPGLKITIIERGLVPSGASTRNAGFACFGSLSELIYDAQLMGKDKMLELVEMRYKGLMRISKYFGPAIDFDLCGGYELYDDNSISSEQLQENIEYLNTILKPITGTKKTYRLADDQIGAFGFGNTRHLVRNNLEGSLHSGKLVKALLQAVQGMGVQVMNQVEAKSFHDNGELIELRTQHDFPLSARQLLICTNAFARDLLPQSDVAPARGQVLLTSPIKNLGWNATFHSDEGFYYFRNLGDRVLLGGARNKAFEEETTTEALPSALIQQELERYLDKVILPAHRGNYTIEHRWAGIMGMGSEKIPSVTEVQPRVFSLVGMGGMGVALAPVVARQAAKRLAE